MALVLGGLLAGALFYFHYAPGLLRGAAGMEAEPDLFPGKTFFVFHNESRQSLRLWVLGFWIPVLGGLAAAPFALRRARPAARPVLVSWLAAWGLMMLLKEPFLFPKLLRWAKEDQFLSPLLCLTVAAGAWGLPRRWMRWAAAAVVVGAAAWLELRDFAHHANSLRL
jgi:drug/metabolite transporter (DMT)-like permease